MNLQDVSARPQTVVTGVPLVPPVLGPRAARQIAAARPGRRAQAPGRARPRT